MNIEGFSARYIFQVTSFEQSLRRRKHLNLGSTNAKWIKRISKAYLMGYHKGLKYGSNPKRLNDSLESVPEELRGFAFEGVGTALALLDEVYKWKSNRLKFFLALYGKKHQKTFFAGVGLLTARLKLSLEKKLMEYTIEEQEFLIDGYGFYFGAIKNIHLNEVKPMTWMNQQQKEYFYRGIGRSLWFICNGNVIDLNDIIIGLPSESRAQIWKGIGIACAYAGKLDKAEIESVVTISGKYFNFFTKGMIIAKEAREIAGIQTVYTSEILKEALKMLDKTPVATPPLLLNSELGLGVMNELL